MAPATPCLHMQSIIFDGLAYAVSAPDSGHEIKAGPRAAKTYAKQVWGKWLKLVSHSLQGLCGSCAHGGIRPPRACIEEGSPEGTPYGSPAQRHMRRLTRADLAEAATKISCNVEPWDRDGFVLVNMLESASRNYGQVDLMRSSRDGGRDVAVKKMPNKWVTGGPEQFKADHPNTSEQPWCDLAVLAQLNSMSCPFVCDLLGVFRDAESTYVVTSLATEGDLFSWCFVGPKPGPARERLMLPIVHQVFSAVDWLHELGIAHRDISLENVLITDAGCSGVQVKLIDFAMATLSRTCSQEVRGKPSYQAPEMHHWDEYDPYLADSFSLGVALFTLMSQEYPWTSTKPGVCPLFEYAGTFGFRACLQRKMLLDAFSAACTELIGGLLEMAPQHRLDVAEARGLSRRCVDDAQALRSKGHPQTSAGA